MPEPEVEYAVRAEHGEIIQRPTLTLAQRTVDGIRGHGGTAVLLSRTVERSEWAEVDEELSVEAWKATFPAILPLHADDASCYRPNCGMPHEPAEGREFDLGSAPDYKCFIEDHAACQEHGYVCTCACHAPKETSK